DHRGEAEPGGEGVAVRRHGIMVSCVSVYVKRGRASHPSRLTNPPLPENVSTLSLNASRGTRRPPSTPTAIAAMPHTPRHHHLRPAAERLRQSPPTPRHAQRIRP